MAYKPGYTEADISKHDDRPNLSGRSPRANLTIEEDVQRAVAENTTWLLAKRVNPRGDSKESLEAMGFKIIGQEDDLFWQVEPPTGWTKSTEGYWTTVKDADGKERLSQFFKGAWYDRDAFLNLN